MVNKKIPRMDNILKQIRSKEGMQNKTKEVIKERKHVTRWEDGR